LTSNRPAPALPEEKQLIHRARQGDKDAYRRLVEAYQDRLFGLVYSLVHNREQCEDLIQEIFVKAYFALQSFEGQSAFYTWIYRIASNHCLDHLRKRRLQQISIDQPVEIESEVTFQDTLEAPASDSPGATMEASMEATALLDELEPDQKLILTMRELEGHSYEDLAEMLDCPLNTVKSRLNRAREALKAIYIKKYGNIPDSKIVIESGEKP
jgi:RNA polymerase sigma-70 factor (ECF subfamily)